MLSLHLNSKCSFSKQNSRTIQSNKSHASQVFQALSRTRLTFVRASLYSVFSRNAWSHWRMATKRYIDNAKEIIIETSQNYLVCIVAWIGCVQLVHRCTFSCTGWSPPATKKFIGQKGQNILEQPLYSVWKIYFFFTFWVDKS